MENKEIEYQFLPLPYSFIGWMDAQCLCMFAILMRSESYWMSKQRLDSDGYFFKSTADIARELGIKNRKDVNTILLALQGKGIISLSTEQGKTNRIKINWNVVNSYAKQSCKELNEFEGRLTKPSRKSSKRCNNNLLQNVPPPVTKCNNHLLQNVTPPVTNCNTPCYKMYQVPVTKCNTTLEYILEDNTYITKQLEDVQLEDVTIEDKKIDNIEIIDNINDIDNIEVLDGKVIYGKLTNKEIEDNNRTMLDNTSISLTTKDKMKSWSNEDWEMFYSNSAEFEKNHPEKF